MFGVRTQLWVCRAVLFPTVWGQQKTEHNFRAPVPPGLCQPDGEAGATEWSYWRSERGLPRGHRTRQEAGWARQPRAVDVFVSHIPEDITAVNSALNITDTISAWGEGVPAGHSNLSKSVPSPHTCSVFHIHNIFGGCWKNINELRIHKGLRDAWRCVQSALSDLLGLSSGCAN